VEGINGGWQIRLEEARSEIQCRSKFDVTTKGEAGADNDTMARKGEPAVEKSW
jgi:hypothetical protein